MKKLKELSRLKLGTVAGEDEVVQCNTTDDMAVSDPPQARSKGVRNTRIRGHFKKRKTKPSKDASSSSEKLLFYFIFLLNICYIFITNRHFFCMISQEKTKQQVIKGHSNGSFAGTYDPPIIQPPNPFYQIGSTSANLYGQSYSLWTMPSQVSCLYWFTKLEFL
jgi:hypothetical protein